ncbi:hypothetical protein FGO68_gene714 [Halteria grandinella]|uniref:Protein kinase domain-containing protein n=1 Tax=Halteria grandinella TaxID=5974 RepID=A0A8J8NNS2_HALGN|nr:hypothetical protein FGO68_gene714 [Halteria grandinella]
MTQIGNKTILVSDFHPPPILLDVVIRLHQCKIGFTEDIAKYLFKQLLEALKFIHTMGAAHLDIKHDNIYLDDNCNIVLADYEFAELVPTDGLITSKRNTKQYAPPEVLLYNGPYSAYKRDIYSMGATFYSSIAGQFLDRVDSKLNWKNKNDKLTTELQQLIEQMLSLDPHDRPSADELLEHPWFNLTTHPCASKIQLGILEFSEFVEYLRDIQVKELYEWKGLDKDEKIDISQYDSITG